MGRGRPDEHSRGCGTKIAGALLPLLFCRKLLQFSRRRTEQVAQNRDFRGDASLQSGLGVRRVKRRVVRRQHLAGGLCLGKLVRVGRTQREVEAWYSLFNENREVFRARNRLQRLDVVYPQRLLQYSGEPLVQGGLVINRVGRFVVLDQRKLVHSRRLGLALDDAVNGRQHLLPNIGVEGAYRESELGVIRNDIVLQPRV